MKNILLGLTGSVASILATNISHQLKALGEVQAVCTDKSTHFFPVRVNYPEEPAVLGPLTTDCKVWRDHDEWGWRKRDDQILHIELRKWADVFVIAPLSANTLGKIANGLCDNLLTSVARAWDFRKPFLVAPAMNTMMWDHPITLQQLRTLESWHISVIEPQTKKLACGDEGMGAMADIATIVSAVKAFL